MGENIDHLRNLEEEKEEVLSLCDFPIDNEEYDEKVVGKMEKQSRLSPETTEFFSFFNIDFGIDMCPADDIIFCGKLVPIKHQHVSDQGQKGTNSSNDDTKPLFGFRKRSESLSELRSATMTRSDSLKTRILRYCRSLDYQKPHRMSSSNSSSSRNPSMERNSSGRSLGKSNAKKLTVKPRWYVLMFGMVKFPPEMDLKDIKNRLLRRSPSIMFPRVDDAKKLPPNRSSSGQAAWRFVKALSCTDPTKVDVTSSYCMPRA
ncbi:hypothetical protein SLEP1_g53980 [Rubroshorea leprosula]|uniref:Uncharacterized protein n=1 Tax=Rubroshorea leprosula TaxID=152421 RepID=A0AAV5MB52_9ROSI|nr:hypothetical protein SLEP1_g53980 [Rubroshorea leprosula]